MNKFLLLIQSNPDIVNEKLKNAPDNSYMIGVIIGNIIPFAVLAGLAYFIYYKAKNRKDLD
jgi:formate/nitrite transporter FocA (FNT family)